MEAWTEVEKRVAKRIDVGAHAEAIKELRRKRDELRSRHPRQAGWLFWSALGWEASAREAQGRPRDAIRLLRARLRLRAYSPFGRMVDYLSLGDLLQRLGDNVGAGKAFRQGIRYGLKHPSTVLLDLLNRLRRMNQLGRRSEYVRALKLGSKALTGRAWKAETAEDFDQAIARYVEEGRRRNEEQRRRMGL